MVKFKCKVAELNELCSMASMKGTSEIDGKEYRAMQDMLITVGDNLEVKSISALRELMIKINFKAEILEKGTLAVPDIVTLEKFLGRFNSGDVITVSEAGGKIVLERESPKKTAKLPSTANENVQSANGPDMVSKFEKNVNGFWRNGKSNYNLKVDFNVESIQTVIEDGDVVKQRIYPFVIKDGKFTVSIGTEATGDIASDVPVGSITSDPQNTGPQNVRVAYASGIDNLFSAISGPVSLYLVDDNKYPLILEQHTEKYDFFALLAPRAEAE